MSFTLVGGFIRHTFDELADAKQVVKRIFMCWAKIQVQSCNARQREELLDRICFLCVCVAIFFFLLGGGVKSSPWMWMFAANGPSHCGGCFLYGEP